MKNMEHVRSNVFREVFDELKNINVRVRICIRNSDDEKYALPRITLEFLF